MRQLLTLALLLTGISGSAQGASRDWYRTEVLIFARGDAEALAAESWSPLPELAYPASYRFLLDPALADARLARSEADVSRLDLQGTQRLTVPFTTTAEEPAARPDSALVPELSPESVFRPDVLLAPDPNSPGDDEPAEMIADDQDALLPADPDSEPAADEDLGPMMLPALPYERVPDEELELTAGARQLARAGQTVLFHGAWWAPLAGADATLPIVIDRGGDVDQETWPALQGSLHIYRSRYLHANLNLWLNTAGGYLPDGWFMPAPPLPRASLLTADRAGDAVDPFAEPPGLIELLEGSDTPDSAPAPRMERPQTPPSSSREDGRAGAPADRLVSAGENDPAGTSDPAGAAYPVGAADPILASVLAALDARDREVLAADQRPPMSGDDPAAVAIDSREPISAVASQAQDAALLIDDDTAGDGTADDDYPFRHAIVHRQARRMRSSETHYLDHPVLGVLIRITPAEDDHQPVQPLEHAEWRLRHGLPDELVPENDPSFRR